MRSDGLEIAQAVQSQPFQVVQFPEGIAGLKPARAQQPGLDQRAGAESDQTEGMLLFIFNQWETPVRKLLDGRGLIKTGQGQEAGNGVRWHEAYSVLRRMVGVWKWLDVS